MKKKKINQSFFGLFALFVAAFLNPFNLLAQPDPGSGPDCWPPPCIPIDTGVGFLVAAGIAIGLIKLFEIRFQKEGKAL